MGKTLQLRKRADYDVEVAEGEPFALGSVELVGEAPETHAFSEPFVRQAITEGWASLGRGKLTLHLADGDLVYGIAEAPGRYDDPESDSGYRITNAYTCQLEEA